MFQSFKFYCLYFWANCPGMQISQSSFESPPRLHPAYFEFFKSSTRVTFFFSKYNSNNPFQWDSFFPNTNTLTHNALNRAYAQSNSPPPVELLIVNTSTVMLSGIHNHKKLEQITDSKFRLQTKTGTNPTPKNSPRAATSGYRRSCGHLPPLLHLPTHLLSKSGPTRRLDERARAKNPYAIFTVLKPYNCFVPSILAVDIFSNIFPKINHGRASFKQNFMSKYSSIIKKFEKNKFLFKYGLFMTYYTKNFHLCFKNLNFQCGFKIWNWINSSWHSNSTYEFILYCKTNFSPDILH